jgi:hypothetical protein
MFITTLYLQRSSRTTWISAIRARLGTATRDTGLRSSSRRMASRSGAWLVPVRQHS